jgi:hypothetical protein
VKGLESLGVGIGGGAGSNPLDDYSTVPFYNTSRTCGAARYINQQPETISTDRSSISVFGRIQKDTNEPAARSLSLEG